jgi:DNA invertase Pin-like site-specific DNA recombinase
MPTFENGLIALSERGYRIGESHHNAKLTDDQVEKIRCMHDCGLGYQSIANQFGVSKSTVRDIVNFRNRATVPAKYRKG